MAILACEVCGGELMKHDGVFTCQGCGCKYSLEEARKMLNGDSAVPAPVVPTVKIDREQRLDNLRQLAERAKDNSDSEAAANYYGQILLEDPDDWRANFYATYYAAHHVKIAQLGEAARRVSNCLNTVLDLIDRQEEFPGMAYVEVMGKLNEFRGMLQSNAVNNLGSTVDSIHLAVNDWLVPALEMVVIFGELVMQRKDGCNAAEGAFKSVGLHCGMFAAKMRNSRLSELNRRIKKDKIALYWLINADEKAKLDARKQNLDAERGQLEAKQKEFREKRYEQPAWKQQKALRQQVKELYDQKDALGVFKAKEKKELQAQIDEMEKQIEKLDDEVRQQQGEIDRELDVIEARLKEIRDEQRDVEEELTRDR